MENKRPLYVYVIGVAVVWTAILGLMWWLGRTQIFYACVSACEGFMLGMLAMYIAVHLYKWK